MRNGREVNKLMRIQMQKNKRRSRLVCFDQIFDGWVCYAKGLKNWYVCCYLFWCVLIPTSRVISYFRLYNGYVVFKRSEETPNGFVFGGLTSQRAWWLDHKQRKPRRPWDGGFWVLGETKSRGEQAEEVLDRGRTRG